jgi:pimeloyl-ACP methyl ester carboxylesterase
VIATSGQAKVAYDVTGGGKDDRPPVLLFHAGVTDRRSWAPLVEALGPGHSTIDFDRRGFGETRYQPEPHSHVNDALAIRCAVCRDPAGRPGSLSKWNASVSGSRRGRRPKVAGYTIPSQSGSATNTPSTRPVWT